MHDPICDQIRFNPAVVYLSKWGNLRKAVRKIGQIFQFVYGSNTFIVVRSFNDMRAVRGVLVCMFVLARVVGCVTVLTNVLGYALAIWHSLRVRDMHFLSFSLTGILSATL